jgi:hypothetical protein
MSLDGHVLCQRMLIGPVWAWTAGAVTAVAAAVAPAAIKNLRRLAVFDSKFLLIECPSLGRFVGLHNRCPLVSLTSRSGCYSGGLEDSFTGLAVFHKPAGLP